MSLQSIIQNLSEKPDHIRRRYSLLISFGVTAVIFVFWLSSFDLIKTPVEQNLANIETGIVQQIKTPTRTILASVGSFAVDIKDIFFGPKKVIYSSVEVKPGRK